MTIGIPVVACLAAMTGGPPDIYARLIAAALTDMLGQQVIVENRSGAAGTIGTASVARAAPDGYTLLLAEIAFVVGPNLFAKLKYVPLRDFVPVVSLSRAKTRALFAGSQGGTVARAGGNACGPLSARLDLRPRRSRGRIRITPDHLSRRTGSRGLPPAADSGS